MLDIYKGLVNAGSYLQSLLLLSIRLYWGYGFFLSGLGKFQNISHVIGFFQELGIPFALVSAYLAAGVEFVGGLLLIVGLGTRLAVIPLAFTMVVAYLTAHSDSVAHLFSDPGSFVREPPFNYLLTCLILFAFGAGVFSLDFLLGRFFRKGKNNF